MREHVPPGTTIGLSGPLGAGKTRWVQAFALAWGVPAGIVVSPTFVLCQEYAAERGTIYHLDVYRLTNTAEFLDLGVDDLFAATGIVCIEWADRVTDCLPADRMDVRIELVDSATRRITISVGSAELVPVLSAVRRAWSQAD